MGSSTSDARMLAALSSIVVIPAAMELPESCRELARRASWTVTPDDPGEFRTCPIVSEKLFKSDQWTIHWSWLAML